MKIQLRDPNHLRNKYTAALRLVPELAEGSEEFLAICAGLKKTGFFRPILIDAEEKVIDDHSRTLLRAALRWQLPEVPVQVCGSEDAPMLLLSSLAHVRHLSKSAIAYLAVPHLEDAFEKARLKHLNSLKKGNDSPSATEWPTGKTCDDLAEEIGVSLSLLKLARVVRKEFASKTIYTFNVDGGPLDGKVEQMTLREWFEPKLLAAFRGGEHESSRPMGLGGIIAGITAVKQSDKSKYSSKNSDQLELFVGVFGSKAIRQFKAWSQMSADKKREAREQIEAEALKMRPEDCEAAAATLSDMAKIYRDALKSKV